MMNRPALNSKRGDVEPEQTDHDLTPLTDDTAWHPYARDNKGNATDVLHYCCRELAALAERGYRVSKEPEFEAAWNAVMALLPADHVYFGLTHPNPTGTWWASVHGPTEKERCDHDVEHESYPRENGYGASPIEALTMLAAQLSQAGEKP